MCTISGRLVSAREFGLSSSLSSPFSISTVASLSLVLKPTPGHSTRAQTEGFVGATRAGAGVGVRQQKPRAARDVGRVRAAHKLVRTVLVLRNANRFSSCTQYPCAVHARLRATGDPERGVRPLRPLLSQRDAALPSLGVSDAAVRSRRPVSTRTPTSSRTSAPTLGAACVRAPRPLLLQRKRRRLARPHRPTRTRRLAPPRRPARPHRRRAARACQRLPARSLRGGVSVHRHCLLLPRRE